jgi:hypothetical protein
VQERIHYLISIFTPHGEARGQGQGQGRGTARPSLKDLGRALFNVGDMGQDRARRAGGGWGIVQHFQQGPLDSEDIRHLGQAAARLLCLPEEAVLRYLQDGDPAVEAILRERHDLQGKPDGRLPDDWIRRIQEVLGLFGASGLHIPSPHRPAQKDLAERADISPNRMGKLARRQSLPTLDEARLIITHAAPMLGLDAAALWTYVEQGGDEMAAALTARAEAARGCVACGRQPTADDPLIERQGVHRTCLRARRNPHQAAWIRSVTARIAGAPEPLRRAWSAVESARLPITFGNLSAAVGMAPAEFRRAWELAHLPRRPSGRRPSPFKERAWRMRWIDEVDAQIDKAPPELRGVWLELRAIGRPISMRTLAMWTGLKPGTLARRWAAAGLPAPGTGRRVDEGRGREPGAPHLWRHSDTVML